jgi:hypothetical protein
MLSSSSLRPPVHSPAAQSVVRQEPSAKSIVSWLAQLMVDAPQQLQSAVDEFLGPSWVDAERRAKDVLAVLEPYDLQQLGSIVSRSLRRIGALSEGAPAGAASAAAALISQGPSPRQPRPRPSGSGSPARPAPLDSTSFFDSFVGLQGGAEAVAVATAEASASTAVRDDLPGTSGLPACLRCYESRQPLEEGAVLCRDGWMRNRPAVYDADFVVAGCRTTLHLVSLWNTHAQTDSKALDDALHRILRCPLTQGRLENPVLASDGNIYEKNEIEVFQRSMPATAVKSPVSREPFTHSNLYYNFNLVEAMVWLRNDPNFPSFTDKEPTFSLPKSSILLRMRSSQGTVVSRSDFLLNRQIQSDFEDMEYYRLMTQTEINDEQRKEYMLILKTMADKLGATAADVLRLLSLHDVMFMTFQFAQAEALRLRGESDPASVILRFEPLAAFGEAIDQAPIRARLALLYLASESSPQQLEMAMGLAEQAMRLDPENAHALAASAECLRIAGRHDDAIERFTQSMSFMPTQEAVSGLCLLGKNPFTRRQV